MTSNVVLILLILLAIGILWALDVQDARQTQAHRDQLDREGHYWGSNALRIAEAEQDGRL